TSPHPHAIEQKRRETYDCILTFRAINCRSTSSSPRTPLQPPACFSQRPLPVLACPDQPLQSSRVSPPALLPSPACRLQSASRRCFLPAGVNVAPVPVTGSTPAPACAAGNSDMHCASSWPDRPVRAQ